MVDLLNTEFRIENVDKQRLLLWLDSLDAHICYAPKKVAEELFVCGFDARLVEGGKAVTFGNERLELCSKEELDTGTPGIFAFPILKAVLRTMKVSNLNVGSYNGIGFQYNSFIRELSKVWEVSRRPGRL